MAAMRSRAQLTVGSASWITEETRLADEFVSQEVEEFAFSAKNEMEWLNEHMAEVFNRSQLDVAEVFKTPGKLRGKTPRTARKRDQQDARAPLTEVFSANRNANHSPTRKNATSKPALHFQVAEDRDGEYPPETQLNSRVSSGADKENNDSGYHDMTEDEMDVDRPKINTVLHTSHIMHSPPKPRFVLATGSKPSPAHLRAEKPALSRSNSQDTFVSAVEDVKPGKTNLDDEESKLGNTKAREAPTEAQVRGNDQQDKEEGTVHLHGQDTHQPAVSASNIDVAVSVEPTAVTQPEDGASHRPYMDSDESASSSDTSSPRQSIVRKKSSLTFASLPAREPLANKKSFGARASHADPSKATSSTRESQFRKQSHSKAAAETHPKHQATNSINATEASNLADVNADADTLRLNDVSESTKKHNKTSTQRLQERFAMLNKSSVPRTSKSVAANAAIVQPDTVHSVQQSTDSAVAHEENEESWIGPVNSNTTEWHSQPHSATKEATADHPSPKISTQNAETSHDIATIVPPSENGEFSKPETQPDTTFQTSTLSYPELPSEPLAKSSNSESMWSEGPLSASKARLFSVLKSAKGIFASSASVSAQAKMEALSSSTASTALRDAFIPPSQSTHTAQGQPNHDNFLTQEPISSQGALQAPQIPEQKVNDGKGSTLNKNKPLPAVNDHQILETASKEADMNKSEAQNQPITEVNPAPEEMDTNDFEENVKNIGSVEDMNSDDQPVDNPPAPPPKSHSSVSQMQKNGELRRPNRPGKETAPKNRPAPVSIRLASQRIGHAASGSTAPGSSQPESAGPAVPPKQPILSKKASNSSLQTTSSTQSFKTAATTSSSRPKALEAAARKKEQDEREAQRKAEQKREIEKRRAAKAEEERRAAQEQKATEQRTLEAKQHAQKQALEQRKAEALRRAEQHKNQAPATKNRQPEENNVATVAEQSQPTQSNSRSEAPTIRPVSRMGTLQDLPQAPAPHVNPAKPPKRQFNPEMHDDIAQKPLPARPEQQQAKRRRTSEDSFAEVVSRPAMAPPVRPSMIRKDTNNKTPHGFNSSTVASHGPAQMSMKGTLQNLPQSQNPKTPHMNDLAKFSNARIPFAEAPNPPQAGTTSATHSQTVQQGQPQRVYHPTKTPTNISSAVHPTTIHKSSPQYPNGDSIDLPEIATDSEDSDDENDFVPPDWANSPALRELLAGQQLVDPSKVFGPIAPLVMEEVFKGNKDRMARFRNRTSSANWNGPDRLTEEEKKKDREARERFEKDGGWTFNPNT